MACSQFPREEEIPRKIILLFSIHICAHSPAMGPQYGVLNTIKAFFYHFEISTPNNYYYKIHHHRNRKKKHSIKILIIMSKFLAGI